MGKLAAFSLVVIVLLGGASVPGAALQGGPPDHANDGGGDGGPPDHANDGGGDRSEDRDDEREPSDGGADRAEADERDDGPAEDDDRPTDSAERTHGAGDGDVDAPDSPVVSSDSDDGSRPSSLVDSVIESLDPSADPAEETPTATLETASSQDEREQFPFPEETETETETPEAEPEPTETPGSTSTPSADPTPTPTPTPDDDRSSSTDFARDDTGPSVDVEAGDDETTASVSGVDDGESVAIDLRGPATDGEAVGVETVEVGVGDAEPFDIAVTRPAADGPDEPAPGVSLAYFDVETDLADVERATLTVDVEPAALPSDVDPGDVEVLRYHDGEWSSTETSTDADATTVTAETPGFSTFAVAVPEAEPLTVTDTAVPADLVQAGHEPTVRATVENPGERRATDSLSVAVDDETVETRQVTLDGGESTTLAFELPAQAAGERSVAVEGVEAGQLQVRGEDTETPTGAGESGLDFDLRFGIAAASFVALSAAGTGLLAARRDDFEL